jgi:hypothetical protein
VQRIRLVAGLERRVGAEPQDIGPVHPQVIRFSWAPGSPWKPGPESG